MADEITAQSAGTLETPEDAGKGASGVVSRWMKELDLADRTEKKWRERAVKTVERYRDEKERESVARFNILYSNVQTIAPALYNSTPKPDVRRRFRDPDPVGKAAADILERCLSSALDGYDFDGEMNAALLDYLLPGRAVTRVRYIPTFRRVTPDVPAEMQGVDEADLPDEYKPYDAVAYEEVMCEAVDWEDFRRGPGKKWPQVRWIAFRHRLTRDEAVDKFGEVAQSLDLDFTPSSPNEGEESSERMFTPPDVFKRLTVWEVWSKDDRKVYFIAPVYADAPLKVEEDPLRLRDFFPIPRPLYALETTDSLVPVEEYRVYKDQARELDRLTLRINRIVNGLKLRGVYDSTIQEIARVMQGDDNDLIAAQNVTAVMQNGGLEKSIWMLPIDKAASVLMQLYQAREQVKQTIYEITGISDILRGATKASETATAQNIKSQFGSLRIQRRQREIQRYARDLIRLKAEVIGEHFSIETMRAMSGVSLPTAAEKAQALSAIQGQIQQIQTQRALQAQTAAQAQPMLGHNGGPPMVPAQSALQPAPQPVGAVA